MEKKTVWFSALRHVAPVDYELWLESLAAEGWNIDRVGQTSSTYMVFTKTEPKQYRYVFDLNAFPTEDYFNTYTQFGWECIGHMSSCYIWRKAYSGVRPEAFSDRESRVRRNKRVKTVLLICFSFLLLAIAAAAVGIGVAAWQGETGDCAALGVNIVLFGLLAGYLWWAARQIDRHMEE